MRMKTLYACAIAACLAAPPQASAADVSVSAVMCFPTVFTESSGFGADAGVVMNYCFDVQDIKSLSGNTTADGSTTRVVLKNRKELNVYLRPQKIYQCVNLAVKNRSRNRSGIYLMCDHTNRLTNVDLLGKRLVVHNWKPYYGVPTERDRIDRSRENRCAVVGYACLPNAGELPSSF